MNCPRCESSTLLEIDRDGITVDRCKSCRGIWLDRGELEKLIARAVAADDEAGILPPEHPPERRRDDDSDRHRVHRAHDDSDRYKVRDDRYRDESHYKKKKKGSWLGDLFEFGD
jgi:Zn-finger nucleic acid-binding protein